MLRGIRKASSNWLGKTIMAVVMGVLIVSFGIWGIADIFKGFGQSTVAKVGRTEISLNEFRQIYTESEIVDGTEFTTLELVERRWGYAGFTAPSAKTA